VTRGWLTQALSLVLVALGIAILVETAIVGGAIGYLFGVLFVLAGALRLYVTRR
jgi:hypothetical protein